MAEIRADMARLMTDGSKTVLKIIAWGTLSVVCTYLIANEANKLGQIAAYVNLLDGTVKVDGNELVKRSQ